VSREYARATTPVGRTGARRIKPSRCSQVPAVAPPKEAPERHVRLSTLSDTF
jgi:hypothetical protein